MKRGSFGRCRSGGMGNTSATLSRRRRIALARVFLKDRALLSLDEPTGVRPSSGISASPDLAPSWAVVRDRWPEPSGSLHVVASTAEKFSGTYVFSGRGTPQSTRDGGNRTCVKVSRAQNPCNGR